MTKKLLGQCVACNLEKPEERYRYISNYALEKTLIGTAYKICCPEIKVRTLLCNSCYCAIVEHNRNKKYKKKRKIECDLAYQPNNKKKRITLSLEEYQKFVENSKSVEELKIKIQETKIQLEIVTKPISADNNTFIQFFNDKIQRLATVLYNHQHREGNKPVLDVNEFTDLIESRDPNLCGFFNLIFQSMNPNAKGRQTKESLKRKVMLLCYQMAALRNKQVSGTKNVIGLYMAVEELKIKIQETKIQLEIVTKPISADNNTFIQFFNDKIQRLATVLYNHQHREGNKPVLDVNEFTDLIESRDPNLCGFFNLIFQSMNPNAKGRQTKESLKRKVMLLCYQMAALRNKQVSGTKNVIGLYMAGTDTSTVGINTLSNMGLSVTYQTVYNNKKQIANVYEQIIQEYISDNKLLILNIDDYHDLHEFRIPSVTSINRISHMATILLNTNNISPIPLSSAFHNPNGIDANLLKQALNLQYMIGFLISYNTQKSNWSSIKDVTTIHVPKIDFEFLSIVITLNEFDLVETLVVHCYDADLFKKHVRRFDTIKLVDFIPSDLKNMNSIN
ncbi:hypothetical protein Glove_511g4 [Diversispora epigaea]|uniref:Uncharacterized protein n=1 Tax=Diversispora epigaea TaxID=1348612 RepID=A0A397GJA0_9GLOM|nr:hypothetical protein Glove_511g4 [Diversispora epigaea]